MEKYLCIDLSRTKLRYAIVTEGLDVVAEGNEYIGINNREEVFGPILNVTDRYRDEIEGVSITMPGVIDPKRGIAYSGGVFSWVRDYNYAEELSEYIDKPVVICNDAKAAALAEVGYGALKKVQNGVLLMILNTGIGGAVITDGHILDGHHFAAGEFSVISTRLDEPFNPHDNSWAGQNGVPALVKGYAERIGADPAELNGRILFGKANEGDPDALAAIRKYCEGLATGIISLQTILDVDRVSIGGGISRQPILLDTLREVIKEINAPLEGHMPYTLPDIQPCSFGNDANMIGALYHYLYELGGAA